MDRGDEPERSRASVPAVPAEHLVRLRINGTIRELRLDPRVTLLDALRERWGLTGTKKGRDQGACGACTVLADGRRVLSCLTLAVACEGREITTIEGLGSAGSLHPVQRAFIARDLRRLPSRDQRRRPGH